MEHSKMRKGSKDKRDIPLVEVIRRTQNNIAKSRRKSLDKSSVVSRSSLTNTEMSESNYSQNSSHSSMNDMPRFRKTRRVSLMENFPTFFLNYKMKYKNSRENIIQNLKRKVKRIDSAAAILASLIIILTLAENEEFYHEKVEDGIVVKRYNESNDAVTVLRVIIIPIVISLELKMEGIINKDDTIKKSGLLPYFLIEVIVCSIFSPPYFDYTWEGRALDGVFVYSYDEILAVISFSKCYLFLRLFQHYSRWNSASASKISKRNKMGRSNYFFAIKSELKDRPFFIVTVILFASMLYLTMAIRIFERSFTKEGYTSVNFDFFPNSLWLTAITMTTVGYGDIYTVTHVGRFFGIVSSIVGMFLVSIFVVSLNVLSEFTHEEKKAYTILKKLNTMNSAKEKAANVIKMALRLKRARSYNLLDKNTEDIKIYDKLKKGIAAFNNEYKMANSNLSSNDHLLKNLEVKMVADIQDIQEQIRNMPDFEIRVHKILDRQSMIYQNIEKVAFIQNKIIDQLS